MMRSLPDDRRRLRGRLVVEMRRGIPLDWAQQIDRF
jgi:hypothetical protein